MTEKITTTRIEPSTLCQTPEEQAAFLTEAWATGEPSVVANALSIIARARAGGMAGVAKDAGITRAAMHKAVSDNGNPRLTSLIGMFKALGIKPTFSLETQ